MSRNTGNEIQYATRDEVHSAEITSCVLQLTDMPLAAETERFFKETGAAHELYE